MSAPSRNERRTETSIERYRSALALAIKADRLLIDERDGRVMARHLGLPLTGVLGVLLRAKKMKRITAVKPELHALRRKAGFFIAPNLETIISEKARKRCKKIESFDTKAHRI